MLTAREVAETLNVSTGALLRWTRAGQVPAVKLPGGAIRYRPEQIEHWIAERSTARVDGAAEEVSPTSSAAHRRAVSSSSSPTAPQSAATTEEQD